MMEGKNKNRKKVREAFKKKSANLEHGPNRDHVPAGQM